MTAGLMNIWEEQRGVCDFSFVLTVNTVILYVGGDLKRNGNPGYPVEQVQSWLSSGRRRAVLCCRGVLVTSSLAQKLVIFSTAETCVQVSLDCFRPDN